MSNAAAARASKDYRRRLKSGRVVLNVEIDEIELTELLFEAGLLAPLQDHGRDALERGLERLIEVLCSRHA